MSYHNNVLNILEFSVDDRSKRAATVVGKLFLLLCLMDSFYPFELDKMIQYSRSVRLIIISLYFNHI